MYKSMYNFSIELARLGRLMRILFPKSTTSHECLQNTLKIAEKIKVCTGVTIMDVDHLYLDVNRKSVLLESVALSGDENTSVTKLRHVRCEQSLKWDSMTQTCRTCQKE